MGTDFVDDSTDNNYGYYTIMGDTTVALEDMTACYACQNAEYPSGALESGGAGTIEEFCSIILEEAQAEGVRGRSYLCRLCWRPAGFNFGEIPK